MPEERKIKVSIPGIGKVNFPASMGTEAIQKESKRLYDEAVTGEQNAAFSQRNQSVAPIPKGLQPQTPEAPRSFVNSLPAMGGGLTGAYTGALYGAGLGGPAGAALGGVVGAGLGAFGGELLRQGTAKVAGYDDQFNPSRAAEEATTNMEGEMGGQLLGSALKTAGVGTKAAMGRLSARETGIAGAERRGIPLTAADRSDSRLLQAAESGTGRTLTGRQPLQNVAERQSDLALNKWWQPEILDQIAPHMDSTDIGIAVQQALGQSKEKVLKNVSRMWDTASEIAKAKNVQIPDTPIRQLAQEVLSSPELKEAIRRAPSLADSESLRLLRQLEPGIPDQFVTAPGATTLAEKARPPIRGLMGEMIQQGPELAESAQPSLVQTIPGSPTMPYGTAEILRKAVQKIVRDAGDIGVNIGRFKQLGGVIDNAMRDSLQTQAPDAYRIWDSARQLYGPAKEELGSRGKDFGAAVLQKLAKTNPEEVVSQIMKSGLNGIETAKKYLEFSPVWPQIQRAVLEEAMEKSLTKEGARVGPGIIQGQHWQTAFNKNLPALKRILSKATMEGIEEFNQTVRRFRMATTRAGNSSETSAAETAQRELNTLLSVTQYGIAGALYGSDPDLGGVAKAGAVILAPRVIAKILVSPGGAKLLADGLVVQKGSKAAAAIAGRLLAYGAGQQSAGNEGNNRNEP